MIYQDLLVACVIAVATAADLPPDTMRQLTSPVSGYRGEIAIVEVLPERVPSLPPGLDLPKMAESALHYLGNNPVPENNYQCRFWNMLLLCPPTPLPDPSKDPLDGITIGDTESRNDVAFNQMREMCGSEFGRKAQDEVHKRLVEYLRSTPGQLGDDMCWCYLYCSSPDVDSPYAFPWATGKLLQSEVDLYRLTGEEHHKKLARRIFEGLRKAASWDTGRAVYPNGMQGFKPGKNARGYEGHYPPVIGPVTYYGRHCNDLDALAFATAMAEGIVADLQPGHQRQPDGSVRGHNHVQMHAVRGIAELGAETKNVRYLEWAKLAYKYYNDNGFDTGWLPEIRDLPDHNNHTEMCLVGDMTEIEVWLARSGWPGYWDRVDRTIRNIVAPGQFVLTPAIETMWREVNKDKSSAEVDRSIQLLRDFRGGFLSGLTPNDRVFEVRPNGEHAGTATYQGRKLVFDMMGCCPPEGMRALYLAWRDTVVESPEGVMVNLAFDRDAPKAKVISQMPRQGQMVVTARADGDFFLRVPGWAPRSAVKASRGGKPVEVQWGGPATAYAVFSQVKSGETLEISWPLVKFTQRVSHKIFDGSVERAYTYTWVGSTVTAVDPPGEWLPLYGGAQPAK
ncbi:MAG: glycoside hydrolase family protein [Pirellulaceae bacterium]